MIISTLCIFTVALGLHFDAPQSLCRTSGKADMMVRGVNKCQRKRKYIYKSKIS